MFNELYEDNELKYTELQISYNKIFKKKLRCYRFRFLYASCSCVRTTTDTNQELSNTEVLTRFEINKRKAEL